MSNDHSQTLATHEELHVMTNHELAQLLDCEHDHARSWIEQLGHPLRRHLRDCEDGRVVVTDTGLLALWRVRELESLCLAAEEIVARVEAELPAISRPNAESTPVDPGSSNAENAPPVETPTRALALREASTAVDADAGWTPGQTKLVRGALAGIAGTGAMSILGLVGPLIGLPLSNVGAMLAGFVGETVDPSLNVPIVGWAMHFGIGIVLAWGYVYVFMQNLTGPGLARGAAYGILPWLLAMLAVMPVMGMGVFAVESGSPAVALNSLLDHLVYGAVLGALFGVPSQASDDSASAEPSKAG
ncbi:MAG: DUF6789 family protein [Candidatus Bipolaricaulia bacterium]